MDLPTKRIVCRTGSVQKSIPCICNDGNRKFLREKSAFMLLNDIMNRVMVLRLDSGSTEQHTQGQEDEIQALSTIRKNLVPQYESRAQPF